MTPGFFVTGTDTDCGKTVVTLGLMRAFGLAGLRVAGLKPVAAGAEATASGLRNDDALAIQSLCDPPEDYDRVNPLCFAPAIAPHIAAVEAGQPIELEPIFQARDALLAYHEVIVVEGAGGWRVPLADDFDMAELAVQLSYPVILVVSLRLGCLNHALLTQESIMSSGLPLIGWVANATSPEMARRVENIETLRTRLEAPCLGELPYMHELDLDQVAARLTVGPLLGNPNKTRLTPR